MKRQMAALVIGNAEYPGGNRLANPVNDAEDLGAKLKSYGFEVLVANDSTLKEMDRGLKDFRTLLKTHEVGLFFFAGHGMQIEGQNYLLATDTDTDAEMDAKHSSLSLDKVLDVMAKSAASTKIIVLDACRNNPWERRWQRSPASRGLASVYAPKGTIIGFATSPGEIALDGAGRNGTYTEALLQHMDTPDCSIETMFKRVRNTVAAASKGKQTSWEHTSLSGEFYFNLSVGKLIHEYSGTALSDSLFVLDETRKSHKIIEGLKIYTWSRQNAALELLTAASVAKMATDSLFVIGRNIYQAACGGSHGAYAFVEKFIARTSGFSAVKRKAMLDGLLFEIFFNSKGELRDAIKGGCFNEVFELQQHMELKSSFDFIAEALTAAHADFYVLPGKGHELSITVSAKRKKGNYVVDAVYVDADNVLRRDEDVDGSGISDDEEPKFYGIVPDQFNDKLSKELVVPARLLRITYTPRASGVSTKLKVPRGWTVRKSLSL